MSEENSNSNMSPEPETSNDTNNTSDTSDKFQDDPSGRRSKICAICLTNSDSFHLNYGAPTCLSCRAFFRRIVQNGRVSKLTCKRNNECDVTQSNRTKCRKCRLEACLKAGMNMQSVMNEIQKHDRFRNYDKMWKRSREREQRKSDSTSSASQSPTTSTSYPSPGPVSIAPKASPHYPPRLSFGGNIGHGFQLAPHHGPVRGPVRPQGVPLHVSPVMHHMAHRSQRPHIETYVPSHGPQPSRFVPYVSPVVVGQDVVHHVHPRSDMGLTHGLIEVPRPEILSLRTSSPHSSTSVPFGYRTVEAPMPYSTPSQSEAEDLVMTAPKQEPIEVQEVEEQHPTTTEHRQVLLLSLLWSECLSKMKINQRFLDSLIQFHKRTGSYTKAMIFDHLNNIGSLFQDYAKQIPEFKTLSANDQQKQLERAIPMFISFIFAKYLGSSNGSEQFQWLFLLKSTPIDIDPTTLYEVNLSLNLLQDTVKTARCENLIKTIARIPVDQGKVFTIACACLFEPHPEAECDSVEQIIQNQEKVLGYFSLDRGSLWELIDATRRLSLVYANMSWENTPRLKAIKLPFTDMENSWMDEACYMITKSFQEVALGEEHMKHVIASELFEVPFPPNFFQEYLKLWSKRFLTILQGFEEFNALSNANQCLLWQATAKKVFTMTLIKFEHEPDAISQLKFALGIDDIRTLEEMIRPWGAIPEVMPKMGMKRSNRVNKFFDKEQEDLIEEMKTNIAIVIDDKKIFGNLFMFLLLAEAKTVVPTESIASMGERHLTVLYRKLDNDGDANVSVDQLNKCISDLNTYNAQIEPLFCR
ncbi:hypothetical protein TCAL_14390 [Tigriopus californicus]|uniref:Nuclear receptor domain-containing protein n=1 Tax=Tigriopus californicus TaxID=6832 RepID=A0A553PL88_TIGCA|nr:uncharacterized protein LOC131890458 [Tigriopus californicus]XP_059095781.1 uncharacterized protein LOC131890458 [Tigriopus californicus]XP_059095782.1 uncharacterized protein LOC131890458 [Tigriopus californicus]TRY78447.1 hypothetical protein TCAL_14390 [Tigriopus californicus]